MCYAGAIMEVAIMEHEVEELAELRRLLRERGEELARLREDHRRALERIGEVAKLEALRTLHIFGCSSCGGEHRATLATQLHLPVHRTGGTLGLERSYSRAFICPNTADSVLVSDDSGFSEVNRD
jgi:hypothetical protein